jgi:hypothetical protein
VLDIEVSSQINAIAASGPNGIRRNRAWLLVRIFNEPIGSMTLPIAGDGCGAETVAAAVDGLFGVIIRERAAAAGTVLGGTLPICGFSTPLTPPYLLQRRIPALT